MTSIHTTAGVERWERSRSFMGDRGPGTVAWMRRRLCLPAGADAEVAEQLDRLAELALSAMVTCGGPVGPDRQLYTVSTPSSPGRRARAVV